MEGLRITGLTVGYGGSMVIQNLAMEIPEGKLVTLMGSNGVGKSTLLKSLMGVLPVKSGSMKWKEGELKSKATFERARLGFGYVPQGRDIFPFLSVRENLILGLEARGIKPSDRHFRLVSDYFPEIETWFGRKGSDLSGGQQQILAFGRILLCEPRLLLLDEPTEGIQPSIVQQIGRVLTRLRDEQGITILLVEQFVDFALGLANYYYFMEHGELTHHGEVNDTNREDIRGIIRI
ncbi:MAG: ATP-binding cassette domain-containing protein [Spirochaetales bacterium]|jgi:urea transport system ATP-binding protein|nr:ATP-binding cassette domain-containing protein [Spirochaetales bacterium]